MAKFTELFSEYLQNNDLPLIFNEISGLSENFVLRNLNKEIGFETEILFKSQLELIANLYVPVYKKRIEDVGRAYERVLNPNKEFTETWLNTFVNGEVETRTSVLPVNTETLKANNVSISPETTNTEERNLTRTDFITTEESRKILETALNKRESYLEELMGKFDNLFMKVY